MENRELYSITESRKLLGGISRNSIYALLNAGKIPSVIVGRRRFIASTAIAEFIKASTTMEAPSKGRLRQNRPEFNFDPLASSGTLNRRT